MLGSFVVMYLFLGGCGAGVLLAAAAWSLLFHCTRTRSRAQSRAFDGLMGILAAIAFVLLAVSAFCLLLDLGRPQRFFLLFTRPTPSLLTFGSFALLASLGVSGVLAAAHLVAPRVVSEPLRIALEGAAVVLAFALMVYTGLYMALMEAVPLWNNAALPVLLALSSASSGVAVVLLAVPFVRDSALLGGWTEALRRVHRVVLLLEAGALAAFLALALAGPFARPALAVLLAPEGAGPWFAVGFAGLGVIVPLAAEGARALLRVPATLQVVEVLCVLGGLILRFCLVAAGSHWLG